MSRTAPRLLIEAIPALLVLSVAVMAFGGAKAKFASDEVHTIGTSRYFRTLFVERDISPEVWPDDHWTRTQPMLTRYLVGAWLWYRGHDLTRLDPVYDSNATREQNLRRGRGVSDALLNEARVIMRVVAVLVALALYGVIRLWAGPIGGVAAALLACGSPYLQEHLIRVKGEAPLVLFMLAAFLAGGASLRATSRHANIAGAMACGALLGLAVAAKLTAVLGFVAVTAWAVVAGIHRAPRFARSSGRAAPVSPAAWSGLCLVTGALVFVLSNPFLYPDPIGRTWLLLENRREEMADHMRSNSGRALHALTDRAALVWERSLFHETWGASYAGWPIEAALAIVGASWLVMRASRGRPAEDALLLVWAICTFVGVTAWLGFRMQHYFVPTVIIGTLLGGLGVGWSTRTLWRGFHRWAARVRARPDRVQSAVRPSSEPADGSEVVATL